MKLEFRVVVEFDPKTQTMDSVKNDVRNGLEFEGLNVIELSCLSPYQHVKSGGTYSFVGMGLIEKTQETVVVYRSHQDDQIWVRPNSEFFGQVDVGGVMTQRFLPDKSYGTSC